MTEVNTALTCAAREVCPLVNTTTCTARCVAYSQLNAQIAASGILERDLSIDGKPASFLAARRMISGDAAADPAIQPEDGWARDMLGNVERGNGLYLWGRTTGNGKTTLAKSTAVQFMAEATMKRVWGEMKRVDEQLVYFANMPTFFRRCKQIYENDRLVSEEASASVARITRMMKNAHLVIFDDLGAEKPTESVVERFLEIVEHRWSRRMSMIVTSNKPLNELGVTLGARIESRLSGLRQLEFKGPDMRRKGAGA